MFKVYAYLGLFSSLLITCLFAAKDVERMSPDSTVLMLHWIDVWLQTIENYLRRGLITQSPGTSQAEVETIATLISGRKQIRDLRPHYMALVAGLKADPISKEMKVKLKLTAEELEQLKGKVKSAYHHLIKLDLKPSAELNWSKDMLENKIGKQIERIRVVILNISDRS